MSAWSASPALAPSSLPPPRQPPHLKAIFPFDPRGAYGVLGGFRDEYPGGVIHLFRYLIGHFSGEHQHKGRARPAAAGAEKCGTRRWPIPTTRCIPHVYNVMAQKGQHMPPYFDLLINPYDSEEAVPEERGGVRQDQGADLHRLRLVRLHLQDPSNGASTGSQHQGAEEASARRAGASGAALSLVARRVLRWYDHWLKGIDTGIMDEPPVKFWVMGANKWRTARTGRCRRRSGRSST